MQRGADIVDSQRGEAKSLQGGTNGVLLHGVVCLADVVGDAEQARRGVSDAPLLEVFEHISENCNALANVAIPQECAGSYEGGTGARIGSG